MIKRGLLPCLVLPALLALSPAWAALAAQPAASGAPTPASVAAAIQTDGAAQALGALDDADTFDTVTDGIAAADPAWLALVPAMGPGLDADSGAAVSAALALALPQKPRLVLPLLDPATPALDPARVCAHPFMRDEVPDLKGYIRRTRAALRRVRDDGLRAVRDRCLAAMGTAKSVL